MSIFLDSQASLFTERASIALPRVQAWREQALAQSLRVGFPHNKLERWKYASLRALANKAFSAQSANAAAIDSAALPPAPRLVFVNGKYNAGHSDIQALQGVQMRTLYDALQSNDERAVAVLGRDFADIEAPFTSLNTALAEDGLLIDVAENAAPELPLHLVFMQTEAAAGSHYLRHKIECGEHSRLTIIEHHIGNAQQASFSNQLWHIDLKLHAHLTHIRLQQLDSQALQFNRSDAAIAGHAEYIRLDVESGSHFSRNELNISLQGEQAKARSGGVLWADNKAMLDTRLVARHQAPNTQCQLIWRGMADDKARVNFFGGIQIDKGADGANAELSNKNLLLNKQAQINTQPALEIYADEVKAAHGATVGQLDQQAMFYLKSRGISAEQAQTMLTQAFYAEAFALFDNADLLDTLRRYLPPQFNQNNETPL